MNTPFLKEDLSAAIYTFNTETLLLQVITNILQGRGALQVLTCNHLLSASEGTLANQISEG